jgi:predicted alpha/beta hydrolase family esterase
VAAFLIVHGLGGSGPEHWQTWLAAQLADRGLEVAYPLLPDADSPRPEAWLAALRAELDADTTVICHSLGSLLWLHHAARGPAVRVARALLVSPPQPDVDEPESAGFRPVPLDAEGVAAAARETVLVCSTDDPWCPPETSRWIGDATGIPIEWIEKGGHVNAETGYGPWPWVEAWALER